MGFLIDTCIWIEVEQGAIAPADVAAVCGDAPVFLSPVIEDIPGLDLVLMPTAAGTR